MTHWKRYPFSCNSSPSSSFLVLLRLKERQGKVWIFPDAFSIRSSKSKGTESQAKLYWLTPLGWVWTKNSQPDVPRQADHAPLMAGWSMKWMLCSDGKAKFEFHDQQKTSQWQHQQQESVLMKMLSNPVESFSRNFTLDDEEYKLPKEPVSKTTAVEDQILKRYMTMRLIDIDTKAKTYQNATATCINMIQWSHPNIFNAVHSWARDMTVPRKTYRVWAIMTLVKYIEYMENRGLGLLLKTMDSGAQVQDGLIARLWLYHKSWWSQKHTWLASVTEWCPVCITQKFVMLFVHDWAKIAAGVIV